MLRWELTAKNTWIVSITFGTVIVTARKSQRVCTTFTAKQETHFLRRRGWHSRGRALCKMRYKRQEKKKKKKKRSTEEGRGGKKMVVEPEGCPWRDEIVSVIRRKLARRGVPWRGGRDQTCFSSWSSREREPPARSWMLLLVFDESEWSWPFCRSSKIKRRRGTAGIYDGKFRANCTSHRLFEVQRRMAPR